jgi:hypothetical protein
VMDSIRDSKKDYVEHQGIMEGASRELKIWYQPVRVALCWCFQAKHRVSITGTQVTFLLHAFSFFHQQSSWILMSSSS